LPKYEVELPEDFLEAVAVRAAEIIEARKSQWLYGDKAAAEYLGWPTGRVTKLRQRGELPADVHVTVDPAQVEVSPADKTVSFLREPSTSQACRRVGLDNLLGCLVSSGAFKVGASRYATLRLRDKAGVPLSIGKGFEQPSVSTSRGPLALLGQVAALGRLPRLAVFLPLLAKSATSDASTSRTTCPLRASEYLMTT
jgi:hypothetical protein